MSVLEQSRCQVDGAPARIDSARPLTGLSWPLIGRTRCLSALHPENLAHREVMFRLVQKQNTCLMS